MELVTGVMGSLLPKLGELLKEYKLHKGVRAEVKYFEREFEIMLAALCKVAEVPYEQPDKLVKLWTRDVKELSYNMEDFVDTVLVRVDDGRDATSSLDILDMFELHINNMSNLFRKGKAHHQIADAIKDINNQLQESADAPIREQVSKNPIPVLELKREEHENLRESYKIPYIPTETMEFDTGAMGSLLTKREYQDAGGRDGGADMSSSKDKMMAAAAGEEEEVDELLAAISASGGAIRSLPRKLDSLLSDPEYGLQQAEKDEIGLLKHDLEELIGSYLIEPSEVQAPALTAERWVKEVRELSYDIDDFVDELFHDGANARISFARKTSRVKIARLQKKTSPRGWITAEITGFRTRVKEVIQRHIRYHLDKRTMRPKWGVPGEGQPPLLHGVEAVHGLMKELESRLLSDDGDGEQQKLKVVSITGFGGVGKTTLANQLYSRLRGRFECRAFVRTSRKPDMRRLLTNMLSQLRRHQPIDAWEVPDLINNIRTHLQDKKYFIIIDDLWTLSTWDIVSRAFPDSNRCGRVLITTEIDIVAQACCGYKSNNIVTMKPLSYTESTELFLSIAFGHEHECSGQLDEVSCAIIRKCGGLPLAIITIACLLASQRDRNMKPYWNYIQNSMNFNLWTNPTLEGMKQVLNLSYNNLPQRLKACMLYLSIYQEDHIISKDDLVKQWIAEGFISEVEGKDMEEVAERYFNELINKGMIQPVDINYNEDVLSCTVHYMVLNLIRYKSIEENFIITIDHSQTAVRLADKVRRLSLHFGNEEDATLPTNMRLSQVRSLVFSGKCMPSITDFKLLRVLILKLWVDHDDTSYNLNEISKLLFRLRYLDVDACHLSLELPTEMQLLKDLVTLKIDAKVSEVPLDIVHLHGLFHLHLPGETNLPDSIGHMTSLRTLGNYNLSSNSKDNVLNLGKLTNLRNLCLTCSTVLPNNLESNMQHLGSILGKLGNLKSLTLNTLDDAGVTSMGISCDGLSSMSVPPALLERLEFSRHVCTFSSLPSWIGKLNKLCILNITVRELLRNDIDILKGLPALTALSLYVLVSPLDRIVFDGAGFRILKYFKFVCTAPCLAFIKGAMPNVRRLKLGFNASRMEEYSPKLAGFEHLKGLKEISAKIGGACADAESVLITAVSKHASNPRINVQVVHWKFYGDEDRSMSRREQEHQTPEEQDEILEKHAKQSFRTQDEDPREVEKKQTDSRISTGVHATFHCCGAKDPESADAALREQVSKNPNSPVLELKREEHENLQESYRIRYIPTETIEFGTGAMGSLLAKLGELLKDEYRLQKGVRKDVEYLKRELASMHAALHKVGEVPSEQLDEQVKVWARELRELSYDMEDVVDTFMVHVDQDSSKGLIKQMVKLFKKGRACRQIANEIKDIKAHVQEVADRRSRNNVDPRLSALYRKVTDLVGIDEARDELIKRVTEGDDASKQQLKIVSVVGFGGMGKTTIANQVYQKLKKQFDCGAFVSISRSPDMKKVLRDILLDVDEEKCKNPTFALWDEKRLIDELQKSLEHKRYLVVIDDIWNISVWTKMIRCALPDNNLENRIIATTRDLDVANQLGGAYKLQPLSDANSKKLFYGRVFGGECLDDQLREVSDKILRKCGGVPLAIVTIASLLSSKMKNTREWNKVHDSIGAGLLHGPDMKDMRMILSLSYYSLLPHLRTCLLYMSIFPEDYEIKKERLIWLWIAEGFIQYREQGETWETLYELGEYYFNELINRSLIHPVDIGFDGRAEACRVHDMVLDLIRSLSNEENFVTVLDGAERNTSSQSNDRRLSIQNTSKVTASLDALRMPQKLRSLIVFSSPAINLELPPSRFRSLRVLELGGCRVEEACHLNLGSLLHLRYLGLRRTGIHQLPGDIGKLQFLHTLDLRGNYVAELPSTIVQLRQLMCLYVDYRTRLIDGIGNLASLEVLSVIHSYNPLDWGNFVKEMRKLTELRELKIMLSHEDSFLVDLAESLCNLPKIHTLDIFFHLKCLDRFGELWVPPQRLRSLSFTGFGAFSTIPACIERNLTRLSDLSSLDIMFERLRQEEMQILARLPALCSLKIWVRTHGRLIIGADGFHCLRKFHCSGKTPMFQQGAMPRVESVFFTLHVPEKDDGNDGFETGLGNLLSLEDVEVDLVVSWSLEKAAGEVKVKEAEAALRHAADVNPNSPTLRIRTR